MSAFPHVVHAATGPNPQLNYQARLLDNTGAVVPDGAYNLEFKIYQDGTGCVSTGTSPCSGTLKWTETRTGSNKVTVTNGYFSIQLGEVTAFGGSVDWNQDTLWLSVNVGGTGTPSWDGEMTPFRRFAAAPYAMNASQLGGKTAANFLQLAPSSVQADSSTTSSLFINKTGASGNIFELQKAGTDVLTLSNTGTMQLQPTTDGTSVFSVKTSLGNNELTVDTTNGRVGVNVAVAGYTLDVGGDANISTNSAYRISGANVLDADSLAFSAAATATVQSAAAQALNVTGHAASMWSTDNGLLTLQGAGGLTLKTPGAASTGAITLQSGNASAGTAGQVAIDAGTSTSGTSAVAIGTANAQLILIGNNGSNPGLTLDSGTGAINIGTGAQARTTNIATGAAAQTLTLGSTNTTSGTTLQGGSNNIKLLTAGNVVVGTADTTGTLLVLDTKTDATDPTGVEGAIYYNSSSKSFRCYMNGRWRSCVAGTVFANTTVPAAVANTITETNFAQNYSIPANDCQPGRVYRVVAQGVYGTTTTAPNLTMKVKLGATVLASSGAQATTISLTNREWRLEFQFICVTAGASGTVEAGGTFTRFTSAVASLIWEMSNTAPVTVDTTVAQTLQISAQWGTANAANTMTMRQLIVDASGP